MDNLGLAIHRAVHTDNLEEGLHTDKFGDYKGAIHSDSLGL